MTLSVVFSLNILLSMLGISFTNIQHPRGSIYLGVYRSESDFLNPEKACLKKIIPVAATGNFELDCSELTPGVYAVSCFHDLNDNGKLDTNFFGIPVEPYGFSNNARPKFRAPKWEEAKFTVKEGGSRISIRLEKW